MKRNIGISLVAAILLAACVAFGVNLVRADKPTHVEAVFTGTVGLYKGSDVRVLGVKVGKVTSVEPQGRTVLVGLDIDHGQHIDPATGAVIIAPSLVSDRYVQLTQPWVGGSSMSDGTVIPVSRTAVPVELDQLYGSLDQLTSSLGPNGANKNGALADLIKTGAANLDGNGADINKLVTQFGDATGTLSSSDQDLFATVDNLDKFNQTLVQNDGAVGKVNTQLATVSQYLAADRGDLAEAVRTLGISLTQVEKFIRDNRGHLRSSLRQLTGTTRLLAKQKSSLNQVLQTLPTTLQSFLSAYDPTNQALQVRVDLNELSIWGQSVGSDTSKTSGKTSGTTSGTTPDQSSGATSGSATSGSDDTLPPLLLPSVGDQP